MSEFSVQDIADVTQGTVVQGNRKVTVSTYSIDTRTLAPRDFFVAIRGPRFDGHEFVAAAADRGASGALVSELPREKIAVDFPLVRCADTTVALQRLGAESRRRWSGTLIAVTGSSGKTTTKDFIGELLREDDEIFSAAGNLNNQYGLPLVLLRMTPQRPVAVVELGMNHAGEIRQLAGWSRPDIGVLTNVSEVHLEFFSSVDEIAEAKAELIEGIRADGVLVYNQDDSQLRRVAPRFAGRKIGYGFEAGEVRATAVQTGALDRTDWTLKFAGRSYPASVPLAGRHFVYAALAAVAVGIARGVDPARLVERFSRLRPAEHRGQTLRFKAGFTVIDDSYNSNPRALQTMLRNLAETAGFRRRWVVAGEMLELGREAPRLHRECGRLAADLKIDRLVGVRGNANWICQAAIDNGMPVDRVSFCDSPAEALAQLQRELSPGDLVLIKGSRGVRLDEVIVGLKKIFELES